MHKQRTLMVVLFLLALLASTSALSSDSATTECGECGYDNPEGNKFCNKCGSALLVGTDYYLGARAIGEIKEIRDGQVIIDLGEADGVSVGDLFKTVQVGSLISDSESGEVLDMETHVAARIRVVRTLGRVSFAEFRTNDDSTPKVGDKLYALPPARLRQSWTLFGETGAIKPEHDGIEGVNIAEWDDYDGSIFWGLGFYRHFNRRIAIGSYYFTAPNADVPNAQFHRSSEYKSGSLWHAGVNTKISLAKSYRAAFEIVGGIGMASYTIDYDDVLGRIPFENLYYDIKYDSHYEKQTPFAKLGGVFFLRFTRHLGLNFTVDYTFDLGDEVDYSESLEVFGLPEESDIPSSQTQTGTGQLKLNTIRLAIGLSYDFWTGGNW